jgi:hypothetical protein
VGGYTIESNFIEFCDISSFEEEVIYSGSIKVMEKEVHEGKHNSVVTILELF